MKLTKRLFTLLLALLMASACFVGCSGDDNHNDDDDDKNNTSAEIKDNYQNGKDEIIKDDTTANDNTAEDTTAAPDINLPHEHTYENGACTVCGELKLSEGLEYTLNADGESYSLSGRGSCKDAHIVIPATHDSKPVTGIANKAFTTYSRGKYNGDKLLTGITIPNSVTSIGEDAFRNCTSLTSISIPDGVTSIGDYAFAGCDLLNYNEYKNCKYLGNSNNPYLILCRTIDRNASSFEIHGDTKIVGARAFDLCTSLTSITFPDGVMSIGDYAFLECRSLNSVSLPDSVTSIGEGAFKYCPSLKSVHITDIEAWCNISFYHYYSNPCYCGADIYLNGEKLTELVIPDTVTAIKYSAFTGCTSLTSVSLPDSVTSIGDAAFGVCTSLTSITIPDSVTSIGEEAFYGCTSLTRITYGGTVAQWQGISKGSNWDSNTGGHTVHCTDGIAPSDGLAYTLSDGGKSYSVTGIGTCGNIAVIIPSTYEGKPVTSIGSYAFNNCTSLMSITIPNSVTSIGGNAFRGCQSLTSITIPDSVTSIGDWAFDGCRSLTSINIPDSVASIGEGAFSNCTSLMSITIPDGVASIGASAFYGCTSLTNITIPDSVTSIGVGAFYYCSSLTSITFNGTKAQWKAINKDLLWAGYTGNYTIHCTDGDIAK